MSNPLRADAGRTRNQSAGQKQTNENRATDAAKKRANKEKKEHAAAKKNQRQSNDVEAAALRDSTNTPADESALSADERIALLTARLDSANAKNQALSQKNRRLKKLARPQASTEEGIVAILKPKGKFNLQEAMGLSDDRKLFTELQSLVHAIAIEAKIDFDVPWSQQDPGKVVKILRVSSERHKHLKEERYPRHWATASILQRYINSVRAYQVGKGNPTSGVSRRRERLTRVGRLEAQRRRGGPSRRIVLSPPPEEENDGMNVDSQSGTPAVERMQRSPVADSDDSEPVGDDPRDDEESDKSSGEDDDLGVATD
ncbi:hypothetical protein DFH09DRAFT_1314265 [Mycena vulgaris]|nr:hypothetical protein DFH09DRAFT_1314265 [Mycena vulgaris]